MIFCFDLDGTLCDTNELDYGNAIPRPDYIKRVNQLYDAGHTIIIDTARGTTSGIRWAAKTKRQLKAWGLKFHQLRAGTKFYADVYIDDRSQHPTEFFRCHP